MISRIKFVLITFILCIEEISKVACTQRLLVSNDGPALIGANISFSAQLLDYYRESEIIYTFDDGILKSEVNSTRHNVSLNRAFSTEKYSEGQYCMNITAEVYELYIFRELVAKNSTCFQLRRYLIGEILIYQKNPSNEKIVDEVATGENFTSVLNLYDPHHYLRNAAIDYTWIIDMDAYSTLNNSFVYNFTEDGEKLILTRATATFPDASSIFGYFYKRVVAKVPINSVNVSGNPFLHHGDFLMLNVSCNGTPIFHYCCEVLKDNITVENFTCSDITEFNTCHMEIKKFFNDGKHHLGIYIGNDVSEVKRIIEVMVYNVSIKPALSTVIIPIVCSLLTLVIIAVGIAYYLQQRNQLAIEVANFDFQDESDSYVGERTFFEKIFDSLTCRNCRRNQVSCINCRSESDPLLSSEPVLYV